MGYQVKCDKCGKPVMDWDALYCEPCVITMDRTIKQLRHEIIHLTQKLYKAEEKLNERNDEQQDQDAN